LPISDIKTIKPLAALDFFVCPMQVRSQSKYLPDHLIDHYRYKRRVADSSDTLTRLFDQAGAAGVSSPKKI
jgi:hypothetical protein